MLENLTDTQALKYVASAGLAVFVIRELLKMLWYFIKQRKIEEANGKENVLKENSRLAIINTNNNIKELREDVDKRTPHFYDMKDNVDDVHALVTEKSEGVPLIYNKGLEKSVDNLNTSIGILAGAVKDLKK